MNDTRDLNTLFDVLNQGKAGVEFVKKFAEPYQRRLEKTERLISEGRLAVDYQKSKKDTWLSCCSSIREWLTEYFPQISRVLK